MKFFHHKDLGNHLLQLCPKVVKHPVYRPYCSEDLTIIGDRKNTVFWDTKGVAKQSPWEFDSPSVGQEIHHVLWDLEVHYGVNKSPPISCNLSQNNPADAIKICCNIILRPKPRSFELSLSIIFLRQDPISVFLNLCETRPGKYFFYKTRARSQHIYS